MPTPKQLLDIKNSEIKRAWEILGGTRDTLREQAEEAKARIDSLEADNRRLRALLKGVQVEGFDVSKDRLWILNIPLENIDAQTINDANEKLLAALSTEAPHGE